MSAKKSILFVGEAVSLANVTRPLVLAQVLGSVPDTKFISLATHAINPC